MVAPMNRLLGMALGLLWMTACADDATGSGGAGAAADSTSTNAGGAFGGQGGGGGTGGAGGTACVSGLEQASPACTACQDANCCVTASAAADKPGSWTDSAATICTEANCFSECGVAEPECGGIVPSPASCKDELYAACCAEVTACAQSDACVALIYLCIDDQGCNPGAPCWDECVATYGGESIFETLDACFSNVTCG